MLKQTDSFSVPIQQQQQANQQQNIYPWMRRIHNSCGKFFYLQLRTRDMKFNSLLSFCLYSNINIFTIYTQSLFFYGLFMSFSCEIYGLVLVGTNE
jgi:hypothetical protein